MGEPDEKGNLSRGRVGFYKFTQRCFKARAAIRTLLLGHEQIE